jgi:thiamine kinase-like enzyme
MLLETALIGHPLRKAAKRNRGYSLLTTGMQWALELHLMTRVAHCFTEADYQELVADPIKAALEHSSAVHVEAGSLDEIASRLKMLVGEKAPLVCSHNDFRVSNLRTDDAGLLVYDWEFAAWPGLPVLDLLNFAVDYFMETRSVSFARAFTSVLSEDERGALGIDAPLKSYCAQMGMDESLIPLWADLFLIHKLHLAQQVVLPLQIFDGLEWVQGLGNAISSRGTTGHLC